MKVFKPKKCRHCGELFTPKSSLVIVCSFQCALNRVRALKWKEDKAVLKEKLKTISQYKNEARIEFQRWIRKRDHNLPCISCQTKDSKVWHAGHFLKAELYSGLVFDEDNCHKQCLKCNNYLDGNEINYRIGLVKKIGLIRVEWLETNKDRLRQFKYTKQDLINIKNEYKNRL